MGWTSAPSSQLYLQPLPTTISQNRRPVEWGVHRLCPVLQPTLSPRPQEGLGPPEDQALNTHYPVSTSRKLGGSQGLLSV